MAIELLDLTHPNNPEKNSRHFKRTATPEYTVLKPHPASCRLSGESVVEPLDMEDDVAGASQMHPYGRPAWRASSL